MSYLPTTTTTTGKLEESGVLQLSGIILLAIIMLLFMVVMLGIFYRLYSRRHFYWQRGDTMMPTHLAAIAQKQQGLDPSILKSITVIQLSAADRGLECSVCLCDISQGDQARFLPKCNHAFHVHCIDTWFQSHSTCPLCRNPVSVPDDSAAAAVVVETMISHNLPTGASSSSGITNDKHLAIDITSLGTQEGHKSPSTTTATLFRSLSRLLSRDRKLLPSSPANIDAEQPPPSPN